MRAVAGIAGVSVVLAAATAAPAGTQRAHVTLGVLGNGDRFAQVTGQRSIVRHVIMGWSQAGSLPYLLSRLGPEPMLGINTDGEITPLAIARGQGDGFLLALNAAVAAYAHRVYVRPLPEMNAHWSAYCAFDANGRPRGPAFSTAAFRKAFARIALIARGGPAAFLDGRLRRLGLPPVGRDLPRTQARIVWNPQGYGAPDIPANSAQAYYPGDAYVDVVANDLYDQGFNAAWDANERLYAAHPGKPYAIGEWGLWGIDDPAFVDRMATFVRTHPRVELVAYFSGKAGSPWDLSSKPRSRAAYRRLIVPLG